MNWTTISDTIAHEVYLVEGLTPVKPYQFRVAAKNIRGWGDFSVSTAIFRTGANGNLKFIIVMYY